MEDTFGFSIAIANLIGRFASLHIKMLRRRIISMVTWGKLDLI